MQSDQELTLCVDESIAVQIRNPELYKQNECIKVSIYFGRGLWQR